MKKIIAILALSLAVPAFAHDEGHGPKLKDTGKYGGLVSAVVLKSEAGKGTAAQLQYKAELARSGEGDVSVYLYDAEMNQLDAKDFDAKASGLLAAKAKGAKGKWNTTNFSLERKEKAYVGKMPKPSGRPYNIDITVKKDGKEYLTAFDNLD